MVQVVSVRINSAYAIGAGGFGNPTRETVPVPGVVYIASNVSNR